MCIAEYLCYCTKKNLKNYIENISNSYYSKLITTISCICSISFLMIFPTYALTEIVNEDFNQSVNTSIITWRNNYELVARPDDGSNSSSNSSNKCFKNIDKTKGGTSATEDIAFRVNFAQALTGKVVIEYEVRVDAGTPTIRIADIKGTADDGTANYSFTTALMGTGTMKFTAYDPNNLGTAVARTENISGEVFHKVKFLIDTDNNYYSAWINDKNIFDKFRIKTDPLKWPKNITAIDAYPYNATSPTYYIDNFKAYILSGDKTINSTYYQIDTENSLIKNVPFGTSVDEFKSKITVAKDAKLEIYESDLLAARTDGVQDGDKLKVIADDDSYKVFEVKVLNQADIQFIDALNGNIVDNLNQLQTSIGGKPKLKIRANISNNTGVEKQYTLVVSLFDNNKIIRFDCDENSTKVLPSTQLSELTKEFEIDNLNYSVKAGVWNNKQQMNPIGMFSSISGSSTTKINAPLIQATNVISCNLQIIDNKIVITGETEKNCMITILIYSPNGNPQYMTQKLSGSNGNYIEEYPIDMNDPIGYPGGNYTVMVSATNVDALISKSIYVPTVSEINKAIAAINTAKNIDEVKKTIKDYDQIFDFTELDYEASDIFDYTCSLILGKTYNSIQAIRTDFFDCKWIAKINYSDEIQLKLLFEDVRLTKNIDGSDFVYINDYINLSNWQKQFFNLFIENRIGKLKTVLDVKDVFKASLPIPMLNASIRKNIGDLLVAKNNFYQLPLNDGRYISLSQYDKELVHGDLYNRSFSNYLDIRTSFTTKLQSVYNAAILDNHSNGSLKNEMPSSIGATYVTNKPIAQQAQSNKVAFADISDVPWAIDGITYLARKNIITGVGNDKFAPNRNITREEFVKMLILSFNSLDSNAECQFDDLNIQDWFYPYIASAKKMGIVNGFSNQFGTGQFITRQDMAVLIYRTINISGVDISMSDENNLEFIDSKEIADYAKTSVKSLRSNGILSGDENNEFKPLGITTRAEAAKILYNAIISIDREVK